MQKPPTGQGTLFTFDMEEMASRYGTHNFIYVLRRLLWLCGGTLQRDRDGYLFLHRGTALCVFLHRGVNLCPSHGVLPNGNSFRPSKEPNRNRGQRQQSPGFLFHRGWAEEMQRNTGIHSKNGKMFLLWNAPRDR